MGVVRVAGGRDGVQPLCRAHHQNYLDQVQEGPEIVKKIMIIMMLFDELIFHFFRVEPNYFKKQ